MNRKASVLLTLFFSTTIIFSCSSLGRQEQEKKLDADISDCQENLPDKTGLMLPKGWKFETEVTHPGSRSEGSVSRLFYRYNEIAPVFTEIIICDEYFQYIPMINIWDNSGYINLENTVDTVDSKTDRISSLELNQGWYKSADRQRKNTTPPEWIFVKTAADSFWVSPEKINDLISKNNLRTVTADLLPVQNNG